METIVKDLYVGSDSIAGAVVSHFPNYEIPTNVLGWDNKEEKGYNWYFIVRNGEEGIKAALDQCRKLQLRSFTILNSKGMMIGG